MSIDPLVEKYPHNSTYAFSANRVIDAVELEGLEAVPNELYNKIINYGKNLMRKIVTHALTSIINTFTNHVVEQTEKKLDNMVNSDDPYTTSLGLLGEFVLGIGPEERFFGPSHPFTKSLKESNMTTEALKAFYEGYQDYLSGKRPDIPHSYRVDFSYGVEGDTGPFEEFFKDRGYTAAQFIGTTNYKFTFDAEKELIQIEVYDTKTEYSLLYHMPGTDRHTRSERKIMGETTQYYYFTISLSELKKRLGEEENTNTIIEE
jgi:hypothetical protein